MVKWGRGTKTTTHWVTVMLVHVLCSWKKTRKKHMMWLSRGSYLGFSWKWECSSNLDRSGLILDSAWRHSETVLGEKVCEPPAAVCNFSLSSGWRHVWILLLWDDRCLIKSKDSRASLCLSDWDRVWGFRRQSRAMTGCDVDVRSWSPVVMTALPLLSQQQ